MSLKIAGKVSQSLGSLKITPNKARVNYNALVHTLDNPNAYDTSDSDYFGSSVAISGDYAIVGASEEADAEGASSGKAYIINVVTGALVHTLDNPNPYTGADGGDSGGDLFGWSVAISGDYAIVGAPEEDEPDGTGGTNYENGKAYIFNVLTGALLHTLDNTNAYTEADGGDWGGDVFGWSVAIDGNHAIVGAPEEDDAEGDESGKAYIFNVTTGALLHTLDNPNAYTGADGGDSGGDEFGCSVAIDGNHAIVGARYEDDAEGDGSGKAYIFDVTTGALLHTLDNPNPYTGADGGDSGGDYFGTSVAISGNRAIVGAPEEDGPDGTGGTNYEYGKAYIFDVTTGALLHTLDNPNAFTEADGGDGGYDLFGTSVAISGNRAIVGAPEEDDAEGDESGKAYIFGRI